MLWRTRTLVCSVWTMELASGSPFTMTPQAGGLLRPHSFIAGGLALRLQLVPRGVRSREGSASLLGPATDFRRKRGLDLALRRVDRERLIGCAVIGDFLFQQFALPAMRRTHPFPEASGSPMT